MIYNVYKLIFIKFIFSKSEHLRVIPFYPERFRWYDMHIEKRIVYWAINCNTLNIDRYSVFWISTTVVHF